MTTIKPRCMGCGKKLVMQVKDKHVDFYDRAKFMCDNCIKEVMDSHSNKEEKK